MRALALAALALSACAHAPAAAPAPSPMEDAALEQCRRAALAGLASRGYETAASRAFADASCRCSVRRFRESRFYAVAQAAVARGEGADAGRAIGAEYMASPEGVAAAGECRAQGSAASGIPLR